MKKITLFASAVLLLSIGACTKNNSVTPTHSKTNVTGTNDKIKDTIDVKIASPLVKKDTIDVHTLRLKDTIDVKIKSAVAKKDTID